MNYCTTRNFVLGRCTPTEKCFRVATVDDHNILGSSLSRTLYFLKGERCVATVQLDSCVLSLAYGIYGKDAGPSHGCVVCVTASGGIWCIPLDAIEEIDRKSTHGAKKRALEPQALHQTEEKRVKRSAHFPCRPVVEQSPDSNDAIFQSSAKDLPHFCEKFGPAAFVPVNFQLAAVSGATSALLLDSKCVVVFSAHSKGCHVHCFPVSDLTSNGLTVASSGTQTRSVPLSSRNADHVEPLACHCVVPIAMGTHSGYTSMTQVFVEHLKGSFTGSDSRLLVCTDSSGLVSCIDLDKEGRIVSRNMLFGCDETVCAVLPVTLMCNNCQASNGLAFVCGSGRVVLYHLLPATSGSCRGMIWEDHVGAPVVTCCLVHCPSDNGTQTVEVLLCSTGSSVLALYIPSLAEVVQKSIRSMERHNVPVGEVCCLWPGSQPGQVCMRTRNGSVLHISDMRALATTSSRQCLSKRPLTSGMEDICAKLQSAAHELRQLQSDCSSVESAARQLNQALHCLRTSSSPILSVAMTPKISQVMPGVHLARVDCCFHSTSEQPLTTAYTGVITVKYSSSAFSSIPSWSMTLPLHGCAPGRPSSVSVPLSTHCLQTCTVSLTAYLLFDTKSVICSVSGMTSLQSNPCVVLHETTFDLLSFCVPQSIDAVDNITSGFPRGVLQAERMMAEVASVTPRPCTPLPSRDSSSLTSLSTHVSLPREHVRTFLKDSAGIDLPEDGKATIIFLDSSKCWIECQEHRAQPVSTSRSEKPAVQSCCKICRQKTDFAGELSTITISSPSKALLCTVHSSLMHRLTDSSSGGCCGLRSTQSTAVLRQRLSALRLDMHSLRDQLLQLRVLASSCGASLTAEQLAMSATSFRQDIFNLYSRILSFPVSRC